MKQAVKRHPDFIVGLKARMSSSVVGENGITPLERAKAIQKENDDLPLMVHIGTTRRIWMKSPELLSSGDIITHCHNGKPKPHSESCLRAARLHHLRPETRCAAGCRPRYGELQL